MDLNALFDAAPQVLAWVGAVYVAASALHAAALAISKVTPTDADDRIVAKVGVVLGVIAKLAGRVGLDISRTTGGKP